MTNVKQPGGSLAAAVGDGITDDKSAIQAIVNQAAISSIKKVFFPPGVYQVNGDIAIADSVELYGTQSGIAVIKARDACICHKNTQCFTGNTCFTKVSVF